MGSCSTKCDPANEPVASTLSNFISAFFGSVTKTCVNNQVVWTLPCDLDTAPFPGYPRLPGEGLACYFARVIPIVGLVGPAGPAGPPGPECSAGYTSKIYIDPVNGADVVGYGTICHPYQTINYAMSQVSTVAATVAGQVQWCNEKIVFILANGIYNENVVTRWKRARIAIQSVGAKIVGSVTHQALLADFPFGGVTGPGFYEVANNPVPWTVFGPFQTFELIGEGGGVDSAFSSMGLMVTGQVIMDYEDAVGTGAQSWQGRFSLSNFLCRSVHLLGGLNLVSFNNNIGLTVQVDSSVIDAGSIGVLPRSGTLIRVGSNPMGMAIAAHNSQLNSTIGAGVRLLQLDRCRLLNLDRTTGGVTDGFIIGSASVSSSGIVNCTFSGTIYNIGFSAVATVPLFTFDANSLNHFFTGHVINIGMSASVTYILQDDSKYVNYAPAVPADWVVQPTTVAQALDAIAAKISPV